MIRTPSLGGGFENLFFLPSIHPSLMDDGIYNILFVKVGLDS